MASAANADKIELYLMKGWTVREVALKLKCTERWVNHVAANRNLPRNIPVVPNGEAERRILRSLVQTNMNIAAVSAIYQQAPCNIARIVENMQKGSTPVEAHRASASRKRAIRRKAAGKAPA